MTKLILSHYEVEPLLRARAQAPVSLESSPDLGRTTVQVHLTTEGILYPNGFLLSWEDAEDIAAHVGVCFQVTSTEVRPLRVYSPLTHRVVALFPTGGPPTITLSGIPMHRIQGTDPWRDTLEKVRAVRPSGRVLDTCMGLGYTALAAARRAKWVLTVELDPAVIRLAQENPWSWDVFERDNIAVVEADVGEFIYTLPDHFFSVVIHDPPMFSLSGELYGLDFYAQVYRVLRERGRMFHYVGNPEGKMARNITRKVVQRLKQAGFKRVRPARSAFGLIAFKQ